MLNDFLKLHDWIKSGQVPNEEEAHSLGDASCRRLARAWSERSASPSDIGPLVRQVLRGVTERNNSTEFLWVPTDQRLGSMWPKEGWATWGIQAARVGDFLRLSASEWRPAWLAGTQESSLEKAVLQGAVRRSAEPVEADPFLAAMGRDKYLSEGQRQAVRAVLAAPPGATLVVNLPTGSGKSLCGHILSSVPFADAPSDGGLTVVVVPTTALCLDQQLALQQLTGITHDLAYYGGTSEATRERNRGIWRRLHDGTQQVLFTSPESLMLGLRQALYDVARRGGLRALVIDEAHIIEQWGDEFRSAFQEIAGLRRALLREAPDPKFRTLLLSATLTKSSFETLRTLFGQPAELFRMVAAVQLRPEPSWWLARCEDRFEQQHRVLEALRHLPRPLILYTTEVQAAENWKARLKQHGYKRFDIMTGRTPNTKRNEIITRWSEGKLDMVVATSAFGLGIDQKEVRAVVHACVPESLDRLYQEVGRGGRDGCASLSLVIYTHRRESHDGQDDYHVGRRMSRIAIISTEKGFPRWRRMFGKNKRLHTPPHPRYKVPLDITPGVDLRHIGMISEHNEDWNARTLTLMARSGLLELDDDPPVAAEEPTDAAEGEAEQEMLGARVASEVAPAEAKRRVVRILDAQHLDQTHWEDRIETSRQATALAKAGDRKLLDQLLQGKRCAGDVLSEAYSFLVSDRDNVPVARACGGCAHCRAAGRAPYAEWPTSSPWPWEPLKRVGEALRQRLSSSDALVVWTSEADESPSATGRMQRKLLDWSVRQGVRCVVARPHRLAMLKEKEGPLLRSRPVFFAESYDLLQLPSVPTLLLTELGSVLNPNDAWVERILIGKSEDEAPLIVVLPQAMRDPRRSDRLLRDAVRCATVPWSELKEQAAL